MRFRGGGGLQCAARAALVQVVVFVACVAQFIVFECFATGLGGRGGMRSWLWNLGIALPMVVASCGGRSADLSVPLSVQKMMQGVIPADGRVHVRSYGRIAIEPATAVCYFPDGFTVNNDDLFRALGQSTIIPSGSGRLQPATPERCKLGRDTVFMNGIHVVNRMGRPYKLVLAVWQGDPTKGGAVWVGGVERDIDPNNADTWGELPWRMGKSRIEEAIQPAIHLLSDEFIRFAVGKVGQ